jgi:hypothetical protein
MDKSYGEKKRKSMSINKSKKKYNNAQRIHINKHKVARCYVKSHLNLNKHNVEKLIYGGNANLINQKYFRFKN